MVQRTEYFFWKKKSKICHRKTLKYYYRQLSNHSILIYIYPHIRRFTTMKNVLTHKKIYTKIKKKKREKRKWKPRRVNFSFSFSVFSYHHHHHHHIHHINGQNHPLLQNIGDACVDVRSDVIESKIQATLFKHNLGPPDLPPLYQPQHRASV